MRLIFNSVVVVIFRICGVRQGPIGVLAKNLVLDVLNSWFNWLVRSLVGFVRLVYGQADRLVVVGLINRIVKVFMGNWLACFSSLSLVLIRPDINWPYLSLYLSLVLLLILTTLDPQVTSLSSCSIEHSDGYRFFPLSC